MRPCCSKQSDAAAGALLRADAAARHPARTSRSRAKSGLTAPICASPASRSTARAGGWIPTSPIPIGSDCRRGTGQHGFGGAGGSALSARDSHHAAAAGLPAHRRDHETYAEYRNFRRPLRVGAARRAPNWCASARTTIAGSAARNDRQMVLSATSCTGPCARSSASSRWASK